MPYAPHLQPFQARSLADGFVVATSRSGDFAFFSSPEFEQFQNAPATLSLEFQAELRARFLLGDVDLHPGIKRLVSSRIAAKRETVSKGPALHIIVPTLQCAHSCQYCQVSRSLQDQGHTMSIADIEVACDTIFESASRTLTVEFQGGDPLIRFDLVKHAVLRIQQRNLSEHRRIRFVVASTLHQLDSEMCAFFKEHKVYLSTSIDGPRDLHNRNRPIPGRDSYERTVKGIELARELLGHDAVAALMTTTSASLGNPEAMNRLSEPSDAAAPGKQQNLATPTVPPNRAALTSPEKLRLQIMRVQIKLQSLGLYNGQIDGTLNEGTRSALKYFQDLKGLPKSGAMTTPTLNALGVPAAN